MHLRVHALHTREKMDQFWFNPEPVLALFERVHMSRTRLAPTDPEIFDNRNCLLANVCITTLLATQLLETCSFYHISVFRGAKAENSISLRKTMSHCRFYSFTFSHVLYPYQFGSDQKRLHGI